MLVERCVELNKQLAELAELEKKAGDISAFQEIKDLLDTGVNRLRPLHTTMQLFKARGIELINLPFGDADQLFRDFTKAQSDFETSPSSITRETELRKAIFSLPTFEYNLRESLSRSWHDYTSKYSPQLDVTSLEVLASIPSLKAIIESIRLLQEHIGILHSNLPEADVNIQNFHKKIDELKAKWLDLTGEGIPESVITFLRECGGVGGADLDLLTDEVRHWLIDRHIEESFRVVIRRNI